MALNHPVGGLLLPELSGVGKGQTFGEGERRIGNRHIWQAGVWHYSGSSHFPSQRGGGGRQEGGGAPRLPWGRGKGSQRQRPRIRQKKTKGRRGSDPTPQSLLQSVLGEGLLIVLKEHCWPEHCVGQGTRVPFLVQNRRQEKFTAVQAGKTSSENSKFENWIEHYSPHHC